MKSIILRFGLEDLLGLPDFKRLVSSMKEGNGSAGSAGSDHCWLTQWNKELKNAYHARGLREYVTVKFRKI